jgi:hypothetical protein
MVINLNNSKQFLHVMAEAIDEGGSVLRGHGGGYHHRERFPVRSEPQAQSPYMHLWLQY